MPSASIRPHVAQPLDVILQLPPQVVFQRHRAQLRREVVDLSVAQRADLGCLVDLEARHELCADVGADAVEGGEGARDELHLGEVAAEDEDLGVVSR